MSDKPSYTFGLGQVQIAKREDLKSPEIYDEARVMDDAEWSDLLAKLGSRLRVKATIVLSYRHVEYGESDFLERWTAQRGKPK